MSTTEKQSVALTSVAASAFMAIAKLAVGLATGSLGILSEAAHSLLDLGAASLTYFAVSTSDKPADARHPYGHAKIEAVSALIETGLLFLTSLWIVKEAVARLLAPEAPVAVTWYAAAVIAGSIVIDLGRSRALMKVAKATGSQALEADALHFSSDILSSSVVLAGLGFVALGWPQGDAVAALGVAGFVCLAGWRLGRRTIDVLVDTAPEGVADQMRRVVADVPGVVRVDRVRVRPSGNTFFADIQVRVSRALPFEHAAAVSAQASDAIRAAFPGTESMVVAEPLTLDDESMVETVQLLARRHGHAVHDVAAHALDGRRGVSLDLEVDERLTIRAAHDVVTAFEHDVRAELGDEVAVDIHIDCHHDRVFEGAVIDGPELAAIAAIVAEAAAEAAPGSQAHNVTAQHDPDEGLYVAFHATFPDDTPIGTAHDATARLERQVRRRLPEATRVLVHAEPVTHTDADGA